MPKQKKYIGIRTKFIIIVSVLMAFILLLQFYFTNRTQKDIVKELTRLSSSINMATDEYLTGDAYAPDKFSLPDDSLVRRLDSEFEELEVFSDSILQFSDSLVWTEIRRKGDMLKEKIKIEILAPGEKIAGFNEKIKVMREGSEKHALRLDSLKDRFKNIEIDINETHRVKIDSLTRHLKILKNVNAKKDSYSVSFVFPDFTEPESPKLLRYSYNTSEINATIANLSRRNMIVTFLLFGLSIIAIVFIAKSFLRPIHSLKDGFDQLVEGDFNANVESKSNDEMGELAHSFNQMVSELRKNKDKEQLLRRKERLASLGQLAAGVAHEIKNPLNAINLTIEHLKDKLSSGDNRQTDEYIGTVQSEIRRLDKTVNNFLNYVRSEHLVKKPEDINLLLTEVLNLYQREFVSKSISTNIDFDEPFILEVDKERLKTAVVNIIINSIQAMPEGGVLTIKTDLKSKSLIISDNGSGIAEKDREHIFDLFFTTRSSGTGLGLPTAYKIVKEHQGEIEINSRLGEGTEVVITLA
ncbi:MAG: PAS domain-containing sensor histidine kinase [Calditrichaceae bacterium]